MSRKFLSAAAAAALQISSARCAVRTPVLLLLKKKNLKKTCLRCRRSDKFASVRVGKNWGKTRATEIGSVCVCVQKLSFRVCDVK